MLRASLLIALITLSAFMQLSGKSFIYAEAVPNVKEQIKIYHIYNETIFILSISYYNSTDILNLGDLIDSIQKYKIVVYNLNLTERSLRWFISNYNPISDLPFLVNKGVLVKVDLRSPSININELTDKLNDFFKTKFLLLNKTSDSLFFVTGGNLPYYIAQTLTAISYKYGGFYNLTSRIFTQALVYDYFTNGTRKLELISSTTIATSPTIRTSDTFRITYVRFLTNLTASSQSVLSKLEFYLYGISVINSTLPLKFSTSYLNHWIVTSEYVLKPNEKLGNITFVASKLDPFIIVMQRVSPAVFNSTSNLYITVFNLGKFNATEVRVGLNLPDWLSSNNKTLIFKNVSSISQEKSVSIKINGNLTKGIYEIPPPLAYYSYRDMNFTTIGNTVLIGYQVRLFPSLSFYVVPAGSVTGDVFLGPTDFSVKVFNTGNANATDVHFITDYLDQRLLNLTPSKNDTFPVTVDPSKYKVIPLGADVFNNLTLRYFNGSQSYEVKIPFSPLFSFSSTFSFINFLSISARDYSTSFNLTTVNFNFDSVALGLARSSVILIDLASLESQGLRYAGKDSFNREGNIIKASYLYNRGYQHIISLSLNITKHDNFVVAAFQYSEPLTKKILIEPLVFSSALEINRALNSTVLKQGGYLSIHVNITNKGSSKLYDVDVRDALAQGWVVVNGINRTFAQTLKPNETLSLSYVAQAKSPSSPSIGGTVASFSLFGKTIVASSGSLTLNILSQVHFSIYKWNYLPLQEGVLRIFDNKGKSVANVTIENGIVDWQGYIGNFNVTIEYANAKVLSQTITVTATNYTFNLRVYVFDIDLRILDLLGNPIQSAKITILGPVNREYSNGYFKLVNLPKGSYDLIIKVGNYEYKIPLVIDESTRDEIKISLPLIAISALAVDLSQLVGVLLVLFIILFSYAYIKSRKVFKPSSR